MKPWTPPSEPRPDPVKRFDIYPDHGDCTCAPDEAPDGQYVFAAAFDAVVAERDGWQENAEDAARQIVAARAERDAALAAIDLALGLIETASTHKRVLEARDVLAAAVSGSSEPR